MRFPGSTGGAADRSLLDFTQRMIAFRRRHPVFRRRRWFKGKVHRASAVKDIAWLKPDAIEMSQQDWTEWSAKGFMLFLNGRALRTRDAIGQPVYDDTFLLLFNAHLDTIVFTTAARPWGEEWITEFDTALEDSFLGEPRTVSGGTALERRGLSLLVLRRAEPSHKP
jgi:isoamylase